MAIERTPYEQLAAYMGRRHPRADYYFAAAGFVLDEYATLHWESGSQMTYPGLVICPKPDGTRQRKRDGSWASERIAKQAAMLKEWAGRGYVAQFAVGLGEAKEMIDSYLAYSGRPR